MKSIKILIASLMLILLTTLHSKAQVPNNAYADNMAEVESGVFAIYSGDINQDGYIDILDYPLFEQDQLAFATGYMVTDLNGDGYVDILDYPIFEANQLNFIQVVRP